MRPGRARIWLSMHDAGATLPPDVDLVEAVIAVDLAAQKRTLSDALSLGHAPCDASHVAPFLSPCPACGAAL